MSGAGLAAHLAGGVTTVCRAWAVTRRDGVVLGFTDHDRGLLFDGVDFRAASGLTARAVEQSTGLAVDNSEAVGALSDEAIREVDVESGLFDGASIVSWLVTWASPEERKLLFRGALGEIERQGGEFRAELRGLSEALNQQRGRVYQRPCAAVLGDGACGVDLSLPAFSRDAELREGSGGAQLFLSSDPGYAPGWFARGRFQLMSGAGAGTVGLVRQDSEIDGMRRLELWETLRVTVVPGDRVRVDAGCDRRVGTCREKFDNFLNFRGFPDIPGEDWLVSYPRRAGVNNGGSLR